MTSASRPQLVRFRAAVALLALALLGVAFAFRHSGGTLGAMVLAVAAYGVGLVAYPIFALLGIQPPQRRRQGK